MTVKVLMYTEYKQ